MTAAAAPESLRSAPIPVRVELGRATMAAQEALGLEPGAIVELSGSVDEPLDVLVNGRPFATCRLLVVDGDEWAVRIESLRSPQFAGVASDNGATE